MGPMMCRAPPQPPPLLAASWSPLWDPGPKVTAGDACSTLRIFSSTPGMREDQTRSEARVRCTKAGRSTASPASCTSSHTSRHSWKRSSSTCWYLLRSSRLGSRRARLDATAVRTTGLESSASCPSMPSMSDGRTSALMYGDSSPQASATRTRLSGYLSSSWAQHCGNSSSIVLCGPIRMASSRQPSIIILRCTSLGFLMRLKRALEREQRAEASGCSWITARKIGSSSCRALIRMEGTTLGSVFATTLRASTALMVPPFHRNAEPRAVPPSPSAVAAVAVEAEAEAKEGEQGVPPSSAAGSCLRCSVESSGGSAPAAASPRSGPLPPSTGPEAWRAESLASSTAMSPRRHWASMSMRSMVACSSLT
mmetsp:Transcript_14104/g.39961  ORF Transcript_14104/g.39961 Transcript_14104/m.39961 type:complete len:367 (+) Transcript_14104:251-1351(+)